MEVTRELSSNCVRQLLGSISVRQHDILVSLVGPEEVEEPEISHAA